MNIDHRNPRLRRGFAFVALAALLGLSVVALSQCRMVNDTVTGVDIKANQTVSARGDCVHQCNDTYKACKKAEDALHKQNKLACKQAMEDCKRHCYNEGAGRGGR